MSGRVFVQAGRLDEPRLRVRYTATETSSSNPFRSPRDPLRRLRPQTCGVGEGHLPIISRRGIKRKQTEVDKDVLRNSTPSTSD